MPVERPGAQLSAIKDRSNAEPPNALLTNRFRCGDHDSAAHVRIGGELVSSPRCRSVMPSDSCCAHISSGFGGGAIRRYLRMMFSLNA